MAIGKVYHVLVRPAAPRKSKRAATSPNLDAGAGGCLRHLEDMMALGEGLVRPRRAIRG